MTSRSLSSSFSLTILSFSLSLFYFLCIIRQRYHSYTCRSRNIGRIRSLRAPRWMRNNANCQRQKVSFKGIAEHKYLDCSRLLSFPLPPLSLSLSISLSFCLFSRISLPQPPSLSLSVIVESVGIVVVSKRRRAAGFASLRFLSSRDTRAAACVQDSRRSDTRGYPRSLESGYLAARSVP